MHRRGHCACYHDLAPGLDGCFQIIAGKGYLYQVTVEIVVCHDELCEIGFVSQAAECVFVVFEAEVQYFGKDRAVYHEFAGCDLSVVFDYGKAFLEDLHGLRLILVQVYLLRDLGRFSGFEYQLGCAELFIFQYQIGVAVSL